MVIKIAKVNIDYMVDILLGVKDSGHDYASLVIEENPDNHTIHINPAEADKEIIFNPDIL